ncbi:hypothetical protein PRZ48_009849 [Zasmidium cellare]|uniref:C2H2-type domain-containing protein n=1 Tax=Zasmidium cellare TaxID=395010 RepID=A0ABR0ECV6_ZASCE|nr:hypothetical protein PRZ48_009849 [Zasmidium cellare]
MDYSSSRGMDMDDLSPWHVQQQAHNNSDDANIDPRLLNNAGLLDTVGTWSSEESSNSNGTSVPTAGQNVQDVNRSVDVDTQMTYIPTNSQRQTYAPAAPAHVQPTFQTPTVHYEQPWQMASTPMHRYPTRHQLQQMPPTPDTSFHSQERGQNANAYQHGGPASQSGNRYGLLNAETAQMPQYQDPAAGTTFEQYGALTPTSQPRLYDDVPVAPSPSADRGHLPYHAYGEPMQDRTAIAGNFLGWHHSGHQQNIAPSEDIPSWTRGPYSVANFPNVPPPPPTQSTVDNDKGKKKVSARSVRSTGTFICSHPGCNKPHDSKSELDHHARNHDKSKRTKLCPICGDGFLFDKDVKRHMKVHDQERHIFCNYIDCPYRHKGFKRKDHLERHVKNKHKQEEEA